MDIAAIHEMAWCPQSLVWTNTRAVRGWSLRILQFVPAAVFVSCASFAQADDLGDRLTAEIVRNRRVVEGLPKSPLVDSERPRLLAQLVDAESLLKARRLSACIESMASTIPGIGALGRAATGWDDTGKGSGKHIEDLTKEWDAVGQTIKSDRPKFPAVTPRGQSLFLRATSEQVLGQIDEHYAVAVEFGRFSGVTEGAYYLGRAQGQLEFALFLSGLTWPGVKTALTVPPLDPALTTLENDIVTAYAKPGSTAQHSNFILANSSLKLSKELNQKGWRNGALLTLLRSLFALNLATLSTPPADEDATIAARIDAFQKEFTDSKLDHTIGLAFVEKASNALEKSRAGGEAADRERLRAHAIVSAVLPHYLELTEAPRND